jgi:DNA topoisomerase VI subunit B
VDCDAFAQIIKELVDNAVDACSVPVMNATDGDTARASATATASSKRRVRVSIERFEDTASLGGSGNGSSGSSTGGARGDANIMDDDNVAHQDVLRVTVTDNGCGIKDIQASVEAFRTSKAHAAAATDNSMAATNEGQTAGRYGIGLTLCLLHAQRLVPGSCATIKSATATTEHYTFMTCVVDTEGDSVRCIRREQLPKSFASESGTAVSVLVPVSAAMQVTSCVIIACYITRF